MSFSPALVGAKPAAAQHGLMRNSFAKKLPVPARQPVLISAFLGDKCKLQRLSASVLVTSRSAAGWKRWKTLRDGSRNVSAQVGDDGVLPFSRKSLHSGAKRAERTAVAQVDFAVTEDERVGGRRGASRHTDTGKKNNGLFGLAEGSDDEYSEEEYSDEEEEEDGELLEVDGETVGQDELAIASLGIAPEIVDALVKRGITHLFPIQRAVLTPAMDGRDLIGRAKTGTGKTLAFGVPIIDRIIQENQQNRFARRSCRDPRALVLAPTRELAKQVEREFMESAPSLSTICVYGGVSITAQQRQLQKGVDIAVGTPGRIIDLIERGSLNLNEVQFLVLDEADQMLAVGFEEDVEHILEQLPVERQSMLFSATMPTWVKKLARKYLNEPLTIDLVGESDEKLAEGIKLYAVQSVPSAKRTILTDLITVYAKGEKTIIFTQTKRDADEVSLSMGRMLGCEALHGDITQAQREKTLNAFREGRFSVLVATDVAARGLDIPNVDLVVHYEIPNDPETFVHRSGRTGRAGKAGTAILMYTGNQSRTMMQIERDVGSRFEKITPPSSHEVILASSHQAQELIKKVHPELIETFLPTAEKLLEENGPSALAAAIAHLSGFSQPPTSRSLLTFEEGITTMRIVRTNRTRGGRLTSARVVMGTLASIYPPAADQIGKIRIIDDPRVEGAVFDLPEDVAKDLLGKPCDDGDVIDVPKVLPRIEEEELRGRTDSYGRFSGGGGRGGGRGTVYSRSTRDDRRGGGRDSGSRFGDRRADFGEGRFEDRNQSSGRRFEFDNDWNGGGSRRNSRGSDRGGRGGPFSGVCYICNQPGHRASDCPDGRR